MAIYLTPKKVKDKVTKEVYVPSKEFEMTVKRAEEFEKNIRANKGYEDFTLERVDKPKKQNDSEGGVIPSVVFKKGGDWVLITESEANKLGLDLTIEDIKAMENSIISHTNNHFHLPNYSPIITGIQGKRITFDGDNLFKMHDTVEIVGVQYYDGFHYVTSVGTDWIEIDIPFELEGDVSGSLYLIKFPADVRSGAKKVWKHEQATGDKVGVRNESISRWSVTYEKPSSGSSINGVPAYLFDFLKPYEKNEVGIVLQTFSLMRHVETGVNKLGEPTFELKPMYNFTGYIDLMGGSDQQTLNSANIPESSHLLFTKATNIDATNKDKVKHVEADQLYEITFVDNPMQRSHHLEIFLRTVV